MTQLGLVYSECIAGVVLSIYFSYATTSVQLLCHCALYLFYVLVVSARRLGGQGIFSRPRRPET